MLMIFWLRLIDIFFRYGIVIGQEEFEMSNKTYISGPISDMPDGNIKAFKEVANILLAQGIECVNPHCLRHDHDKSWSSYMRVDIKALMDCYRIIMLPGWEKSRGAKIERDLALDLGMTVTYF